MINNSYSDRVIVPPVPKPNVKDYTVDPGNLHKGVLSLVLSSVISNYAMETIYWFAGD